MAVSFAIRYHELVVREDLPQLSPEWRKKIKRAIEDKLTTHPQVYGRPLRQSLKGYWKLRVGDYRIVFRIEGKTVKIFIIQHRSVVYRVMQKRT